MRSLKSVALGGGLYQGVSANVMVSATSWGVYFFAYEQMKTLVGTEKPNATVEAAFAAGVVCNLVTNPLSVMRSRMLLTDPTSGTKYSSVAKTFAHIAKSEGCGGFYKGLVPNLINVSHGTIQFVLYNELKRKLGKKNLNAHESLACCVVSKLVAAVITYPCQNMRARQQAGELAEYAPKNLRAILKQESFYGLYRGLLPTLAHVTPNVCIVFLAYEFFVGEGSKKYN